jgi:hypothetical protein
MTGGGALTAAEPLPSDWVVRRGGTGTPDLPAVYPRILARLRQGKGE